MKPLWISASGVKKWRLCRRQWAFRYIAGEKEPSSLKAGFGSQVDAKVEAWLRDARMPDKDTMTGQAARALIRPGFLPDPSENVKTQDAFKIRLQNTFALPVILNGYKDVSVEPKMVLDVKTTGSKQYMLTEEGFADDPQVAMYQWAAHKRWGVDRVLMRWTYAILNWSQKDEQGRQSVRSVNAALKREQILDSTNPGLEHLFDDISDMATEYRRICTDYADHHWLDGIHQAQPTGLGTGGCDAFGGCHFAALCRRSVVDILKAHEAETRSM